MTSKPVVSISATQPALRAFAARLDRQASLVLAGRLLQNVNGFLLSVCVVRRFGLAAAGTLTIATVATVAIGLLGTFGLTYTLAQLDIAIARKNALGAAVAIAVPILSLPVLAVLGLLTARTPQEATSIALLSLGGPFFAQVNLLNALQVIQGRASDAVIAPVGNLLGLAAAAMFAPTLAAFAILLAAGRFGGVAVAFLRLPRTRMRPRDIAAHLRASGRFLTADAINLGADQATVLLASYLMNRADLGLFGLCRQILTVNDTPGWAKMQAAYPGLVADPNGALPEFRQRMLQLGAFCGAATAAAAVPLGLYVYHLPALAVLGPLLLASSPLRYLLCVYDLTLRAIGAASRANRVALARCLIAVVLVPGGAWMGGVDGCLLATLLNTALALWLTRNAMTRAPPKTLSAAVG